jgi:GAF domain-containing protein
VAVLRINTGGNAETYALITPIALGAIKENDMASVQQYGPKLTEKTLSSLLGAVMRDKFAKFALLLCGGICSGLAWASWHWWSEYLTFAVIVILLLGYAVDNFQLRKQVRNLLAERDQRERRERADALSRLTAGLILVREKKAGASPVQVRRC